MERTLRGADGPPAETGQPLESASEWDLTNETFIDEFDEQAGLYRATYDSAQASPSLVVITVVSSITGSDPLELEPLSESIDAEAVDTLFSAGTSSVRRLTFQYTGYEITVGSDDVVEVVTG